MRYKFSNSLSNSGMVVWSIIIGFIMAPILLERMQTYQYGIWEIIVAIVGYSGVLDLGVKLAVTRFVSLYNNTKSQSIDVLMSTAIVFLTSVGILFATSCLVLSNLEIFTNQFSEVPASTARLCLIFISAQIVFAFPRYCLESYFQGCHRYSLINTINFFISLISFGLILSFLDNSNALIFLPMLNAIVNFIVFILLWVKVSYFEVTPVNFSFSNFEFKELRKLVSFGSKTFIQGLATKVHSTVGVLLVGASFGPVLVPVYSFPAQLFNYLSSISASISQPLLPYFTQHSTGESTRHLARQYESFSAAIMQVMIAGYLITMAFGESFLTLWIGAEIAQQAWPLIYIFAIAVILDAPNLLANRMLTAIDKHGFLARTEIISAVIRVILAAVLINPFGFLGVGLGIALGKIVLSPIVLTYVAKQLEFNPLKLLWSISAPSLLPATVMIISILAVTHYIEQDSWINLFLSVCICGLSYLVVSFRSLSQFYLEQIRI